MRSKLHTYSTTSIIVLSIIFAFVLGVLVYVGGAIIESARSAPFVPEPQTALESAVVGVLLGLLFGYITRKNSAKET